MATSLITQIPIFVFSSQIGDIELSTDQDVIEITLEDGLTEIYRSKLYAFDGKVTIVNIGEVIEQYMRAQKQTFVAFTLYYNKADGTNISSFNINTLYCSLVLDAEAAVFGSFNFLSTLTAKRVPRDSTDYLWLFHGQGTGQVKAHCVFIDENGETANATVTLRSLVTDDIGVTRIVVNQALINTMLKRAWGAEISKLMSYTIEYNNRFMTYYVVDFMPDVSFTFKNCFNVDEIAYFNAITTTKTKVNRSTAVVGGRYLFYDQSVDKTYEVESASLTEEESYWVEQLLCSHSVWLGVAPDTTSLRKVIITDSDCEVHDDDEQLNKVKFTWQFAMKTPHLMKSFREDTNGIFTEPYNATFD